jgi:hypothetical protein
MKMQDSTVPDLTILTKPLPELFGGLSPEVELRWKKDLEKAATFMATRRGRKTILIEVAAQHPLASGISPGPEFTARLQKAIVLYKQYKEEGFDVEIYVPGSRHMDNGREDVVSLSSSGVAFLQAQGVPAAVLHGEDLSDRYKGVNTDAPLKGIYCSADECYVAACYVIAHDYIGKLVSIVGPHQSRRKELHYIANGLCPTMVSTASSELHHDPIREITAHIPSVLAAADPTFQMSEPGSPQVAWRKERMPGFAQAQDSVTATSLQAAATSK